MEDHIINLLLLFPHIMKVQKLSILLELKPLWAREVLCYGYKDPLFSQVLPVVSSSIQGACSAALWQVMISCFGW